VARNALGRGLGALIREVEVEPQVTAPVATTTSGAAVAPAPEVAGRPCCSTLICSIRALPASNQVSRGSTRGIGAIDPLQRNHPAARGAEDRRALQLIAGSGVGGRRCARNCFVCPSFSARWATSKPSNSVLSRTFSARI